MSCLLKVFLCVIFSHFMCKQNCLSNNSNSLCLLVLLICWVNYRVLSILPAERLSVLLSKFWYMEWQLFKVVREFFICHQINNWMALVIANKYKYLSGNKTERYSKRTPWFKLLCWFPKIGLIFLSIIFLNVSHLLGLYFIADSFRTS